MSRPRVVQRAGRAVALSIAVGAVAATVAWRSPVVPPAKGVTFKVVMRLRPQLTRNAQTQPTMLRGSGSFANGRGRIDIDSSSGPVAFSKGDYFVIDSGRTLLIRPSVQTYSEIDSPIQNPLTQMAAQLNNAQIGVSGVKVEMEKLERTDSVGGVNTQHFRIEAEYTLDLGSRQLNSQITTDLWVAKLPFRFVNPVEQSTRNPKMPAAFTPIFDKIAAYSAQIANEGAAVRSVTTTTFAVGATTYDVMQSTEILDVKAAEVDEAVFRIPDRFRKGGN